MTDDSSFRETLQQLFSSPIHTFHRIPTSGEATLYQVACEDEKRFIAKLYNVPDLFWIEVRALTALQETKRVCELVHTSFQVPEFFRAGQAGPHFVVKPHFDSLLNSNSDLEPVVAVERAAQLVDISKRFLELGWRDLDGRDDNDAVDSGGWVVRFDLDAAISLASVSAKEERRHLSGSSVAEHQALLVSLRRLIAEQEEVHSVARRVSRFLLRQDSARWSLLEKIVEGDEPGALAEWVSSWRKTLRTGIELSRVVFSEAEATALARLLYGALRGRDYSLTLNDLHVSMLAILSVACQRVLDDDANSDPATRLQRLLPTLPSLTSLSPSAVDEGDEPSPITSYEARTLVAGGAWRATLKGSDWKSQDLVVCSRPGEGPFVLLADGASLAHGDAAIEEVERWSATMGNRLTSCTAATARDVLRQAVAELHDALLKAGAKRRASCETTLVLGYLCQTPGREPILFIITFGNSGYMLTQGPPGNAKVLLWGRARNPAPALGSPRLSLHRPEDYLLERPLPLGQYRLRVFSDGVFSAGDTAYQMFSTHSASAADLVDEAAGWNQVYPQIGGDDWSLAAMDVEVVVAEPDKGSRAVDEGTRRVRLQQPVATLSSEGDRFWRETWKAEPEVRDVIRGALPDLSLDPSPVAGPGVYTPQFAPDAEAKFTIAVDPDSGLLALWHSTTKGNTRVENLGYLPKDLQPASWDCLRKQRFVTPEHARQSVKSERKWRRRAADWVTMRGRGNLARYVTLFAVVLLSVAGVFLGLSAISRPGDATWRVVQVQGALQIQKLPEPEVVDSVPTTIPPGAVSERTFRTRDEAEAYVNEVLTVPQDPPADPMEATFSGEQVAIYRALKNGEAFVLDSLPSGTAITDPRIQSFVQDAADVLRTTRWRARLEVHTAIAPNRNTAQRLSRQRADLLTTAFESALSERGRIVVEGMGDSRPLASSQRSNSDATNRRLELRRSR